MKPSNRRKIATVLNSCRKGIPLLRNVQQVRLLRGIRKQQSQGKLHGRWDRLTPAISGPDVSHNAR